MAYTWLGVTVALTLIGMPFVVRTVQPALQEVQRDLEEAAETLGAGRFYIFRRIILPTVLPALLTGFTLAFARAVGEYGSVIFIAGNLPMKTEITPLLIVIKLEEFDYNGRRGARLRDAGHVVRDAARHQPAAGLGPAPARAARHADGRARQRPSPPSIATPPRARHAACTRWCAGLFIGLSLAFLAALLLAPLAAVFVDGARARAWAPTCTASRTRTRLRPSA